MTADFRVVYDSQNPCVSYNVSDPTPWKNGGNEYRLLFKNGDCVDLQLSPSGHKTGKAAAGGLCVLMANFNGYTVTAVLPWAVLGVDPKAELKLRGDAGFILSDSTGTINMARVYWSNKSTGLVMDQPDPNSQPHPLAGNGPVRDHQGPHWFRTHGVRAAAWLTMAAAAVETSGQTSPQTGTPLAISGIYPHLAAFNGVGEFISNGECGIGAVVPWAGRLWFPTYPPHATKGSNDKLHAVGPDMSLDIRPGSVGGPHANRMIHEESQQIIGPYSASAPTATARPRRNSPTSGPAGPPADRAG